VTVPVHLDLICPVISIGLAVTLAVNPGKWTPGRPFSLARSIQIQKPRRGR